MTATKTVAKWQHVGAVLDDPTWTPESFQTLMLREFWQAANLGAIAETELDTARAENARLKEQLLRWARSAGRVTP